MAIFPERVASSGLLLLQFLEMDDDVENLSSQTRPEFRERTRMRIPVVSLPRAMWARDRRTNARPPSVHPRFRERRTKEGIVRLVPNSQRARVPHASSQRPLSSGTIDSNFHLRKERWKGGSRVEILCSLFVNLLPFEIYRCHRPIGILPDFYLLAIT